jgi:hypothetical protein
LLELICSQPGMSQLRFRINVTFAAIRACRWAGASADHGGDELAEAPGQFLAAGHVGGAGQRGGGLRALRARS